MHLKEWYKKRGINFILIRARRLRERYGFSSRKSIERIEHCMAALRELDCCPTFAVPGIVVERNSSFIRHLQEAGAEIAVHGYNHVDLKTYTPEEGSRQLKHAADVFRANGLEIYGFRCPYLSVTDDLIGVLPSGIFEYSSNKAIQWPIDSSAELLEPLLFQTIQGFYEPANADTSLCLPWFQDSVVEIPVCVPDDLQLHDGLGWGLEQISKLWSDILRKTYQRGEIFNLMFHPELATFCEAPFLTTLREARFLQPGVWVAQLNEISDWWKEKSDFRVETTRTGDSFTLNFHCTPRATILGKGFEPKEEAHRWNEEYWRLASRQLSFDSPNLPFIGLPFGIQPWVTSALERMGYILETGENARHCSLYLDEACSNELGNPVDLAAYIESVRLPLVRFWPWPDGMRSTLCITGDLDALSLLDYAIRLLKR